MEKEPIVILLVEDSEHDIIAFKRAWRENGIRNELRILRDGQQCLDYLLHRNRFEQDGAAPRPRVILLNNRMPRMEGLTVLAEIRRHGDVANIPIIMFTSAGSAVKESQSYDLGANAYVVKPMNYEDLSRIVRRTNDFWELVEVPEN
jgi:CheY-like chemotaxis protein